MEYKGEKRRVEYAYNSHEIDEAMVFSSRVARFGFFFAFI